MKVLIVEDDAIAARVLEATLQQLGHEPVFAADSEDAWARRQAAPLRTVVSGWQMTRLDGLELCRRIRALHEGLGPLRRWGESVDHFQPFGVPAVENPLG